MPRVDTFPVTAALEPLPWIVGIGVMTRLHWSATVVVNGDGAVRGHRVGRIVGILVGHARRVHGERARVALGVMSWSAGS